MKKRLNLICLFLLLAACAGVKPQRPPGFEDYRTAAVEVVAGTAAPEEQAQALRTVLVEILEERQVFHAAGSPNTGPAGETLVIQARITRLKKVPNVDRIALGSMAGSNVVVADIAIMDGATQRLLSSFRLQGESPDYPPSLGWPWGSLDEAMKRLARQLAGILLEWKQADGKS